MVEAETATDLTPTRNYVLFIYNEKKWPQFYFDIGTNRVENYYSSDAIDIVQKLNPRNCWNNELTEAH